MKARAVALALFASMAIASRDSVAETPEEKIVEPEPRTKHRVRAFEEIFLINGPIGCAWYWINADFNQADWDLRWDWDSWKRKVITYDAVRFDSNDYLTNSAHHALSGSAYYLVARANGLSLFESFAFANVGSLTWEYLVEFKEMVSLNDVIFTPFVGVAIGEPIYQLAELFERGSDAYPVRLLALILGMPRPIHDRIDHVTPSRAKETDALGLPTDRYHRFTLSAGVGKTWFHGEPTPRESRGEIGFDSEVVTLSHYDDAGHAGGFVTNQSFSRLAFEASIGERRLERANLLARTTLFGWYHQEIERARSGHLRGTSIFAGAATEFEYEQRQIEDFSDKLAMMHIFGPAFDVAMYVGGLRLRASMDVTADFAMVTSPAATTWLKRPHGQTKSVLEAGYYYAFGLSANPSIEARIGPFDAGIATRLGWYSSIDGRDRFQHLIVDDAHLRDTRLQWRAYAGISPVSTLRLQASFAQRYRESHVRDVSASSLERSTVIGAALVF